MSAINASVTFDTLQSFAGASLSGTFQLFATFSAPGRLFMLQNFSGQSIDISDDGTRQVHWMPTGSGITIDVAANKQAVGISGGVWYVKKGTRLYVRTSTLVAPITLTSFSG